MAKRKDDKREPRPGRRARLNWIVAALVLAAVTLCGLSSWEDKHGSGLFPTLELPRLGFLGNLIEELAAGDGEEMENAVMAGAPLPGASLEVHIQDMGQADSILIKGPGANALIDAGENDQGRDVLRYLRQQGVGRLDYVIGTHPHSDHIGGLDVVIRELEVGQVILPELPDDIVPATQTYGDLLDAIGDKGLPITPARPGKRLDLGDGAQLLILAPIGEYTDLNNMSVVSRLSYGDTSFLFTGDASAGAEGDLLDSGAKLKSDVLDVGHHGSDTSTTESFLDAVSPRIATISCGLDNSYGHPHREVMERLESRGVRILRTDLDGAIVIVSNGERLNVSGAG